MLINMHWSITEQCRKIRMAIQCIYKEGGGSFQEIHHIHPDQCMAIYVNVYQNLYFGIHITFIHVYTQVRYNYKIFVPLNPIPNTKLVLVHKYLYVHTKRHPKLTLNRKKNLLKILYSVTCI